MQPIRWLTVIEEALHSRSTVVLIVDAHNELSNYQFTNNNWQMLKDTYYFLQPFYTATKLCKGDVTMDRPTC